jgi:hypothetical protein
MQAPKLSCIADRFECTGERGFLVDELHGEALIDE